MTLHNPITSLHSTFTIMRNSVLTIGLTLSLLAIVPSAFAQTAPTMNQPDWGFFEGPNPEWATLHSTSIFGTEEHREYHRDAVRSLLLWNQEHRSEQGTTAYRDENRLFHQERNMLHRQFHTAPVVSIDSTPPARSVTDDRNDPPNVRPPSSVSAPVSRTYIGKPSRRSIVAAAEERNRVSGAR